MEEIAAEVFKDTPTLLLVFVIARWLGERIDRTLDLHERMLLRLLDLSEAANPRLTDSQRTKLPPLS